MKIICVEDEKRTIKLINRLCKQLPQITEVVNFSKSLEALEYLKENSADIALIDFDIPNMNAITLGEKMRESEPLIPIVFLSDNPNYALDAFRIHANGFLLKPIEEERLMEELNYMISLKSNN